MSELIRVVAIVVGIAVGFGLLYLNKRVAAKYWLPAVEDVDDEE